MGKFTILPAGNTVALDYACTALKAQGFTFSSHPDGTVTHLLLPVPSFQPDGSIKGGGQLEPLLQQLPQDITVLGGNLHHPALTHYPTYDLLKDEAYLAENANITAHCAIQLAMTQLPRILESSPVLVIGWGRIGKCLGRLLHQLGADVTIAARKAADRAMAAALGYKAVDTAHIQTESYRVVFNTAPQLLLPECNSTALKIDLASSQGITGPNVLWARGLPNLKAPESSGELIARHIANYLKEVAL